MSPAEVVSAEAEVVACTPVFDVAQPQPLADAADDAMTEKCKEVASWVEDNNDLLRRNTDPTQTRLAGFLHVLCRRDLELPVRAIEELSVLLSRR